MFDAENLRFTVGNITISAWHAVLILIATYWIYRKAVSRNYPPCISGWIPFLGCAIEFGKEPLHFIKSSMDRLGPVFTLYVAGKRMTFVADQYDFQKAYFQSTSVCFQHAVTDAVKHNASIPPEPFLRSHTKIHDCVKGRLAIHNLPGLSGQLCGGFKKQITALIETGNHKVEFNETCRDVMYAAIIDNLFGEGMLPTSEKAKLKELTDTFVLYDDQFEYGSQLPELFLKDWSKAKWWLINLFRNVVEKAEGQTEKMEKQETLLHSLMQSIVDKEYAPNFGLMMMWASLANAIPITFWTIIMIINDEAIHNKVKQEVLSCLQGNGEGLTEAHLKKMPYLKQCMMETIRLRSPGVIARQVMKPFLLRGYTVPAGDMLMLSPYWAHRDTKYFPEPETFNPDRWEDADLEKNIFLDGFVAFGGGRYQCPGRWFALMEIHMVIAMMFNTFDMKLLSEVPPNSPLHVVGVQQPTAPCYVQLNQRQT